jgi:hypothetical protein
MVSTSILFRFIFFNKICSLRKRIYLIPRSVICNAEVVNSAVLVSTAFLSEENWLEVSNFRYIYYVNHSS